MSRPESALLRLIEGLSRRDGQIVRVQTLPAREAHFGAPERPLPPEIGGRLEAAGVTRLYRHQAEALDRVRAGENVVVVTGTASGKTLCYNLPVLETVLADPQARALYLFPTKALAQDQLKGLRRFLPPGKEEDGVRFVAGTYDGDTPADARRRLRDGANLLLTNPDMLHSGILANHPRWAEFFANLRYVVLDEIHVYRGIFGSHVANVLHRLRRVCRHHGADPLWICSSATIANPAELAGRLTAGLSFRTVDGDGSPRGTKHFVLWNPPRLGPVGMERRSANHDARELLVQLLRDGYQAIAFVKTRAMTEVLLRDCRERLREDGGGLGGKIRSYRAGYLAEERRKIEAALFDGELLAVISTSALELGIDVGSLDAALLVGYPGTIASTWQQAGRAGRRESESAAVLVGHNAPIDQYLMTNPEYFFGRTPENAVCDPGNAHLLLNHLRCAAFEIPIRREEEAAFGEQAPAILDLLQQHGHVREVKGRWFYTREDYPSAGVSLRNAGDNVYTILDTTAGGEAARGGEGTGGQGSTRVLGTIDELSAFWQVHPQAVYMHEGDTYFVDRLDLGEKAAYVHRADLDYYTQAVSDSHIEARDPDLTRRWREAGLSFGPCSVHHKVTMFKKIRFGGRDSLGFGQIDLPHTTLHTTALWLVPSAGALRKVIDHGRVPADGLQGIANVLLHTVSLHVMCDPLDLGTVIEMRNTQGPTLFLYDRYPGGLGYAQRAWHLIEEVMQAALSLIRGCACEEGCPSCVGSPLSPQYQQDPDLDLRGRIPDKEAALILLHALLELPDYTPRVPLAGAAARRARAILAAAGSGTGAGTVGAEGTEAAAGEGEAGGSAAGGSRTAGRRAGGRRAGASRAGGSKAGGSAAEGGMAGGGAVGGNAAGGIGPSSPEVEAPLPERKVVQLSDDLRRKLEEQLRRIAEEARRRAGRARQPWGEGA